MKAPRLNFSVSALTIFCVAAQLLGAAAAFFTGISPQTHSVKTQLASAPANGSATLAEFQNSQPLDADSDATFATAPAALLPTAACIFIPSHRSILSARAIAGLGLFVRAP